MTEATDTKPDTDRHIETFTATWQGLALEITYEACWLSLRDPLGHEVAHLAVRSVAREPLPITETGYRSHFTTPEPIVAAGGPVAFVLAWLDAEARTPAWRARAAAARQLSLF